MSCCVCAGKGLKKVLVKGEIVLSRCRSCGMVQVPDAVSAFDIARYDYYRQRLGFTKERLYDRITEKRYKKLLEKLKSYRLCNRILDVGCGEGHFLATAASSGWEASGIDPSPYAVQICRSFSLNVRQSDLLAFDAPEGYYDIITMFEVMEHIAFPVQYLRRAHYLLRKGGVLAVTTPNFNSLTRRLLKQRVSFIHAEHLLYFTPAVLEKMMRENGFKVLSIKTRNVSIAEFKKLVVKESPSVHRSNQDLRRAIEGNGGLLFLKSAINAVLDLSGSGETMDCLCLKV